MDYSTIFVGISAFVIMICSLIMLVLVAGMAIASLREFRPRPQKEAQKESLKDFLGRDL